MRLIMAGIPQKREETVYEPEMEFNWIVIGFFEGITPGIYAAFRDFRDAEQYAAYWQEEKPEYNMTIVQIW